MADFIPDSEATPDEPGMAATAPASLPAQDGQNTGFIPDNQATPDEEKFATPIEMAKTFAEGTAKGIAGPLATGWESLLLHNKPQQLARQETNPLTHTAGELTGLIGGAAVAPEATLGGALGKVGTAVAEKAAAAGAGRIAAGVAAGTVENMLYQAQDETSKMILNDPEQTAQTAAASIGLAGLIGGGFGAISPLWHAAEGNKLGQTIEDFKSQWKNRLENPNPVDSIKNELEQHYAQMTSAADEVYGTTGLKAQEIQKLMPTERLDKVYGQAQDITTKVQKTIDTMESKPNSYPSRLTEKLKDDLSAMQSGIDAAKSPGEVFTAIEDFKKTTQGYSKFDKFVKPVDEAYDFVKQAKSLAHDTREALEDSGVWGKAGDRQKAINGAFKEYLPALKDFEKKFTTEVGGEKVIDPSKVSSYVNQLGKPNAEIKQEMLKNFIDASNKYQKVITDTHANLGLEAPFKPFSLNNTMGTFEKQSAGAKLANALIDKGLSKASGAAIGAAAGHATGIGGGLGAIIGEHALGPIFSETIPVMIKPLMEKLSSGAGYKTAQDYIGQVIKASKLLSNATGNIFKAGTKVIPDHLIPTDSNRDKINKALNEAQKNPSSLLKMTGDLGHYAPDHATALSQTGSTAAKYLLSIRPNTEKTSPLDTQRQANPQEKAQYKRALDVAQQPLIVFKHLAEGRLTPADLVTMKTIYPALYATGVKKLTEQMSQAIAKGTVIPYKTKMGISLYMGHAMDSTMQPGSIVAAQPQPPANQPQTATHPAQNPKRSTTGLNKMPKMYKTQAQAAEEDRTGRE